MSKYDAKAKITQRNSMRIYLSETQVHYKDTLKISVAGMGFESMSEYVVDLIEKDLKRRSIIR
tara:strand:- start:330 stop:518 length:189 start_codon:yes stop_codon:yes gene_type:complete